MNILVLEDDIVFQTILKSQLEELGHMVGVRDNGVDILKIIRNFDLLITDIMMTDVEGLETIITIRDAGIDIPIIAISSNASYLGSAMDFGASAILPKPINIESLQYTMDLVCKK